MGSVPLPVCPPQVVANPAYFAMWSAITAAVTLSISRPPYASGISAELRPRSPAFFKRSRVMEKSLCSIFSALGRISLTANSSAVCPMSWCCSVKSSGVKTSSVRRSSSRKLPPEILVLGIAAVTMEPLLTTKDTKVHEGKTKNFGLKLSSCTFVSFVVYCLFSLPACAVHEALDAVLQVDNIEVYKQSQRFATELQVRKDLGLMDGRDGVDGFDFHNDQVINEKV